MSSQQDKEMDVQDIKINSVVIVENSRLEIKNLDQFMRDIKQHGLQQPIGVSKAKSGEHILMWGHRRLQACKKLGWQTIPAHVYPEMAMSDLLLRNLGENLHREDITPSELGRICDRLMKYELNIPEIAIKLSIPKSAVVRALSLYRELPDKYRSKVAYYGPGKARKDGSIPASIAGKVLSLQRTYKLSDAVKEKLLYTAKMEELTLPQLGVVSKFLEAGHSVTESINALNEFSITKAELIINKKEMDAALAKYKIDSTMAFIQAVFYGLLPPMKKPDFVVLKQIPDFKK